MVVGRSCASGTARREHATHALLTRTARPIQPSRSQRRRGAETAVGCVLDVRGGPVIVGTIRRWTAVVQCARARATRLAAPNLRPRPADDERHAWTALAKRITREQVLTDLAWAFDPLPTFAAVTDDGWFSPDMSAWFGLTDETPDATRAFQRTFVERFLVPARAEVLIVRVDCHVGRGRRRRGGRAGLRSGRPRLARRSGLRHRSRLGTYETWFVADDDDLDALFSGWIRRPRRAPNATGATTRTRTPGRPNLSARRAFSTTCGDRPSRRSSRA